MLDEQLYAFTAHLVNASFNGLLPVLTIGVLTGLACGFCVRVSGGTESGRLTSFAVFFGLVGGGLGLLLGASREPAVNAFLPAIVTALSGLFVFVFPREVQSGRIRLHQEGEPDDSPAFVRSFVVVGVAALMISSVFGAFWGGSIRSIKEEDAKRYAEWKAEYETIELPLRKAQLAQQLNLSVPEASEGAGGE